MTRGLGESTSSLEMARGNREGHGGEHGEGHGVNSDEGLGGWSPTRFCATLGGHRVCLLCGDLHSARLRGSSAKAAISSAELAAQEEDRVITAESPTQSERSGRDHPPRG